MTELEQAEQNLVNLQGYTGLHDAQSFLAVVDALLVVVRKLKEKELRTIDFGLIR